MSLSTVIQRHLASARVIRRHVSSQATKSGSHGSLPSAKMRALISLYHQADTFVTPENLSQRIDEAFLADHDVGFRSTLTLRDLENALTEQRAAPKVSEWNSEAVTGNIGLGRQDAGWSSIRAARELKVIEALYGVDTTHPRDVLPGLEVLEESAESIRQNVRDDLEDELELDYESAQRR